LKSRRLRWLVSALGVAAAVLLLWRPFLWGFAAFMHVSSPLRQVDVILPVYDESVSMSTAVADLYHRGLAPRIVLPRLRLDRLQELGLMPPDHEVWRRLLEARGVPPAAMETIGSDIDDAVELGAAVGRLAPGSSRLRVLVVASSPFSRLVRSALRRGVDAAAVDLVMYPVMPPDIDERAWWRSRDGWIAYFDAYCLWLIGFVR